MMDKDLQVIREVLLQIERGLEQEQIDYTGILYVGLMLTNTGPKVLEFNCRFGDQKQKYYFHGLKQI